LLNDYIKFLLFCLSHRSEIIENETSEFHRKDTGYDLIMQIIKLFL
jgi:hypothetical protein